MTDYLNGASSNSVNYSLYGAHDGSTTLFADLVGAKLDYDNLKLEGLKNLNNELFSKIDASVILTDHSNVDYDQILKYSDLIIDTRNVFPNIKSKKIKRLGEG